MEIATFPKYFFAGEIIFIGIFFIEIIFRWRNDFSTMPPTDDDDPSIRSIGLNLIGTIGGNCKAPAVATGL